MDKLQKCQYILLGMMIFIFIMIGISLALLLNKSYAVTGLEGFLAWECVFFFFFLFFAIGSIFTSRKVRMLFSFIMLILSGSAIVFLIGLQSYSALEIIFIIVLGVLLLLSLLLFIFFEGKQLLVMVLCYLIGIGGFIIFFSVFFNKPFFLTILQFSILLPLSLVGFKYSVQTYGSSHPIKIRGKILKIILIIIPLLAASILLFPAKTIEIDPKNSPEIIFWSDTSALPTDENTLNDCYENDIGFCVVLRDYGRYLSSSASRRIEYLLNHSIITYIALGGPDGSFYCTTDSAESFVNIFKNIRYWLITNNLYYYPSLRGFVLDCETPREIIEDIGDKSFLEKSQYFIKHMPSRRDLNRAEEALEELIELIHDDEKVMGIIKLPSFYDELDFDSDYSILTRNIYGLDLDWDFSISMNYRTQHMPGIFDYMITDMDQYSYTSDDYELEYLQEEQLERNTVPLSTFYYEVAFELNSNELGIDPEDRYIFLGTFKLKFKDTDYIKDKEYQQDLDICRHFGVKKVWMYEWRTWKHHYSLDDLIDHNEDLHEKWSMHVPVYMFNREIFLALCTAIGDRFLYVY